jgi:hypothetical protein
MAKFYLTNAMSINMFEHSDGARSLAIVPVTAQAAHNLIVNENAKSAIGHKDTARIVSSLLGIEISANRETIKFPSPHSANRVSLVVAQYSGPRLPEGTTELPEGAKIEFWQVYQQ